MIEKLIFILFVLAAVLKCFQLLMNMKLVIHLRKIKSNNKTMLPYCLKSRKNTESKNPTFVKTKNGRMIILSNYMVCNSKKSRFIKEQEASGLLSGPN